MKSAETEQEPRRPDRPQGDTISPAFEKKGSRKQVVFDRCRKLSQGNRRGEFRRKATTGRSQFVFRFAVAGKRIVTLLVTFHRSSLTLRRDSLIGLIAGRSQAIHREFRRHISEFAA